MNLKRLKCVGYEIYTNDMKKLKLGVKEWEKMANDIRLNPTHPMRKRIKTVEEIMETVDEFYILDGEEIAKPLPENWKYKRIPVCRWTNEGECVVKCYEKEILDKKGNTQIINKPYEWEFNFATQKYEIVS